MTAEGLTNQFKKRHDRAYSQSAVAIAFQTKRLSSGKSVTNISILNYKRAFLIEFAQRHPAK